MIDRTFWPAPMEGVFTESFIRAVNELELTDVWMTSFFRLSESMPKLKIFREFLAPYAETHLPVSAQLMGRDPELLAQGALLMLEAGAAEINLNFACPAPRVTKGGCGGAMLKEIPLMGKIVSTIKSAIGNEQLSVKLRSGYASPDEIEKIIPHLKEAGCDRFIIHFRTVKELYAPVPDRSARFRRIPGLAGETPVILNGDFSGAEQTLKEMEHFNCYGVMLGRKFLSDPGVLRRLGGKSDRTREAFYYALVRNGVSGDALKGLKRWIFGSWNYPVPEEGCSDGK